MLMILFTASHQPWVIAENELHYALQLLEDAVGCFPPHAHGRLGCQP